MELSRTSLLWSKYGVGLGMIVKFFSVTVFLVLFFTEKEGISLSNCFYYVACVTLFYPYFIITMLLLHTLLVRNIAKKHEQQALTCWDLTNSFSDIAASVKLLLMCMCINSIIVLSVYHAKKHTLCQQKMLLASGNKADMQLRRVMHMQGSGNCKEANKKY